MELGHTYDFSVIDRNFEQKKSGEVVTAEDWNNLILALLASNKINSPQLANVADDLTVIAQAITSMVLGEITDRTLTGVKLELGAVTEDELAMDSVGTPAIKDEAVTVDKCISGIFTQLLKGNVAYYANQGVSGVHASAIGELVNLEINISVEKEHNLLIIVCSHGILFVMRGLDKVLWLGIVNNPLYDWQAFSPKVFNMTDPISGVNCYAIAGGKNCNIINNLHFDETIAGQTKLVFTLTWTYSDQYNLSYDFGNSIFAI